MANSTQSPLQPALQRSLFYKAFVDNPLVLRDLRATMRGTRAFWFQGTYLLLLGALAVAGYATATGQSLLPNHDDATRLALNGSGFNLVDAQGKLQLFYYFIFVTLAALITLIAPALTATSITDERSRQSLDLVITTPLSAFEMLSGKLIASLAFLGLLLALSLPASALCVLLGGATIGDIFRIYWMLGVDAVVLASIGLYFSCACKNSLQAIVWTYGAVGAFVCLAYLSGAFGHIGSSAYTFIGAMEPFTVLSTLSPFAAVQPFAASYVTIGALHVPLAVLQIPAAAATAGILLTAATFRFGVFGGAAGRALRVQLLAASGVVALLLSMALSQIGNRCDFMGFANVVFGMVVVTAVFAIVALPFLPGLFVPVCAEETSAGDPAFKSGSGIRSAFDVRAMFAPTHGGSLPYFLAWLAVATLCGIGGVALRSPAPLDALLLGAAVGFVYVGGAGTMLWGISRVAARLTQNASAARALAFGIFILAVAVPALPLTFVSSDAYHSQTYLMGWLGAPMLFSHIGQANYLLPFLTSGGVSAVIGFVAGMLAKVWE